MIHNLQQAENAHRGHFFDKPSKRFFKSRMGKFYPIPGGAYFITSEQDSDSYRTYPRRYTIRHIHDDGTVSTRYGYLNGFQRFATAKQAQRIAKRMQQIAKVVSDGAC